MTNSEWMSDSSLSRSKQRFKVWTFSQTLSSASIHQNLNFHSKIESPNCIRPADKDEGFLQKEVGNSYSSIASNPVVASIFLLKVTETRLPSSISWGQKTKWLLSENHRILNFHDFPWNWKAWIVYKPKRNESLAISHFGNSKFLIFPEE